MSKTTSCGFTWFGINNIYTVLRYVSPISASAVKARILERAACAASPLVVAMFYVPSSEPSIFAPVSSEIEFCIIRQLRTECAVIPIVAQAALTVRDGNKPSIHRLPNPQPAANPIPARPVMKYRIVNINL